MSQRNAGELVFANYILIRLCHRQNSLPSAADPAGSVPKLPCRAPAQLSWSNKRRVDKLRIARI